MLVLHAIEASGLGVAVIAAISLGAVAIIIAALARSQTTRHRREPEAVPVWWDQQVEPGPTQGRRASIT